MGKLDARLEVRIDRPTLNRLERLAAHEQTTLAALVREVLQRFVDTSTPPSRAEAMERAFQIGGPVPADPGQLKELLRQRFDE